jgi:hypothetical protein
MLAAVSTELQKAPIRVPFLYLIHRLTLKRQLATEVTEKHRELQEKSVLSPSPKGNQAVCCIFLFFL